MSLIRRNLGAIVVFATVATIIFAGEPVYRAVASVGTTTIGHMRVIADESEYVGRAEAYANRMAATASERASHMR